MVLTLSAMAACAPSLLETRRNFAEKIAAARQVSREAAQGGTRPPLEQCVETKAEAAAAAIANDDPDSLKAIAKIDCNIPFKTLPPEIEALGFSLTPTRPRLDGTSHQTIAFPFIVKDFSLLSYFNTAEGSDPSTDTYFESIKLTQEPANSHSPAGAVVEIKTSLGTRITIKFDNFGNADFTNTDTTGRSLKRRVVVNTSNRLAEYESESADLPELNFTFNGQQTKGSGPLKSGHYLVRSTTGKSSLFVNPTTGEILLKKLPVEKARFNDTDWHPLAEIITDSTKLPENLRNQVEPNTLVIQEPYSNGFYHLKFTEKGYETTIVDSQGNLFKPVSN